MVLKNSLLGVIMFWRYRQTDRQTAGSSETWGQLFLLGAFQKWRKVIINFVMSSRPPVRPSAWNNSAPTGRIVLKFRIWIFFENLSDICKFRHVLPSAYPSVRMEQLGSHWTDCLGIPYLNIFRKICRRYVNFHPNMTRVTGTLHEARSAFMTIFRSVLLRKGNALDKICWENQNTHFVFNFFFRKIVPFVR
jgi:hypothetical protein